VSSPVQPTPVTEPQTPSAPAPVTPPLGSPAPEPWRAPANAPAWAAGKSADEILNLSTQMAEALARGQAPAPVQQPQPLPNGNGLPNDEMWIARPNDAARMVADQRAAEVMAPAFEGLKHMAGMVAAQTRGLASQQFKDDFTRWGPEIDAAMSQVSPELRTLDNYEKVVKFVRGNHVDEIVAERAKQLVASGGLGERSGGANGLGRVRTP
jgi:hypothetical protein